MRSVWKPTNVACQQRRCFASAALMLCVLLSATSTLADTHAGTTSNEAPRVLITGANRGLGLEFARQFAKAGWQVIGTARKPARAQELAALDVEVLPLDVTDRTSVAGLADALNGRPLDMLINNAGIFPRESKIDQVNPDNYTQMLMVNTLGPMLVTQALLPHLKQGEMKRIVNITSQLASIENNGGGFYGYRESKAALNMFTKSLAAELGPDGFICLAIHPGWVRTDMGGPSATLSPEESVSAMREVIDGLTAEDNGRYRAYNGEIVAW